MTTIGNIIADSLSLGMGYADRLLKDVKSDQFARFASGAEGKPIVSNHPSFVYGHLSLYAPRIIEQLGGSFDSPPDSFDAVYSKDATCQDDPDGTVYPAMDDVLQYFNRGYTQAIEVLRSADDDQFQQANPAEGRLKELFPTMGSMHAFYAGGHFMIHMGQISAWRRMTGLGSA